MKFLAMIGKDGPAEYTWRRQIKAAVSLGTTTARCYCTREMKPAERLLKTNSSYDSNFHHNRPHRRHGTRFIFGI